MAKIYLNGKWKKKTLIALSLSLAATLSLGAFSACAKTETDETDDSTSKVAPTDTQILKNGNFEFYSDKLVDDVDGKPLEKKNIITSSFDGWSFTSGSPSSETKSGIIDTADWDYFTKTGGYTFRTVTKGEGDDEKTAETFGSIEEAYAHWTDENVSAYDRLKFLDFYKDDISALQSNSEEKTLFNKYNYSIDFEDVEKINEEAGADGKFELHPGAAEGEGKENDTSVLMIHNEKEASGSDNVNGTAQYFTSSSLTLTAGTAAKVSVWVRTDNLRHWGVDLTRSGGAYIGVTHTVGGNTLDQMQIYNIHTDGQWQQYTVYLRASTFATTTFRIVLGLGQGNSDDKYYMVDGYAFFDDVVCELMPGDEYETAIDGESETVKECTVDSLKEEKQFDYDKYGEIKTYGLDLYAPNNDSSDPTTVTDMLNGATIDLTSEVSGSKTYTSADKGVGKDATNDYTAVVGYTALKEKATSNSYLKKVLDSDFEGERPFPFDKDGKVVMLLSAGGAAYTAKLGNIELEPDHYRLISFFVKSSKIPSGLNGAGAIVVDGENKTYISPFDTTTLADVNIDSSKDAKESLKDIYKGWTQCFFFLENTTDKPKTFHIELTYGPTSIVSTDKFDYGDGYAAFTNFETRTLTKAEYGYVTTGDRAKKISLTGGVEETKKFDSVVAPDEKVLENGLASPANYYGVLGGSDYVQSNDTKVPNQKPDNVQSGLLNSKYAANYFGQTDAWKTTLDTFAGSAANGDAWWNSLFGNARQPLVIVNNEAAAWGYFASDTETVSASSYRRISMRVKVSAGATANIYLTDVSGDLEGKTRKPLSMSIPALTYWYDDDGNICGSDPTAEDYDKNDAQKGILYELQSNGLYLKKGEPVGRKYYANLANYEKDDEGNLLTKDGTIAYYYSTANGAYFTDSTKSTDALVYQIPDDVPRHYDYSKEGDAAALAETTKAQITVTDTNGQWETVNFYVHTGDTAKTYRLEVWSGSRDGKVTSAAGSFVAFDNLSSTDVSSNFTSHRDLLVQQIKDKLNEGKKLDDEGYLGSDDPLPEKYARYYTFTFFDSPNYLRYDETQDSEGLGDPYYSYKQSEREELLVWLSYRDETTANSYYFLDFDATDVTVERDYPPQDDGSDDTTSDDATESDMNIWLLISSGSLAVILVLVILALIVRRIMKKFGKRTKVKAQKDKRYRPSKKAPVATAEDEEPETDETDSEE